MFDIVAVTEPALIDAVYEDISMQLQEDLAALLNVGKLREWQLADETTQQAVMKYLARLGSTYHLAAGEQLTNTLYNLAALDQYAAACAAALRQEKPVARHFHQSTDLHAPIPPQTTASRPISTALVSKIGYDDAGRKYAQQLHDIGIDMLHTPFVAGETGLCISIQFSSGNLSKAMATRLSNFQTLSHHTTKGMEAICQQTRYLLMEGYLMNSEPDYARTFLSVAQRVKQTHNPNLVVGLTLSAQKVAADIGMEQASAFDLIAANDDEFNALCGKKMSFEQIQETLDPQRQKILIYTRGKYGSILSRKHETEIITAQPLPPEKVIDVTGAGDAFLAGVLYGLLQNYPLRYCGKMGSIVAEQIVQTHGARIKQ